MTLQIAGLVPASFLTRRGSQLQRMNRQGFEVEVEANYEKVKDRRRITSHTATVYDQNRFIVARCTVNGSRGDAIDEAYTRWRRWRGDVV